MVKKQRKNKSFWLGNIRIALPFLAGILFGFFIGKYIVMIFSMKDTWIWKMESVLFIAVLLLGAVFLQILIHESGHLIFGLVSGYKFCSFRILNFMLVKYKTKLKCKKLSIAGTLGQCLMSPPEMKEGKIPVLLYNFGGAFLNFFTGINFLYLSFISDEKILLLFFLKMLGLSGLLFALLNGIPLRVGIVNNDGFNALELSKNKKAMRSFWIQMKINEEIINGHRLKDMPEEWFAIPENDELKNSMISVLAVFACNRLMDEHRFDEADAQMRILLTTENGIVDLYKSMMICDRMYIEMITRNRSEVIDKMYTEEQKKIMKAMKDFPSVIRTEYVYALLYEKNENRAEKIKIKFEKQAKMYPYENEIQGERELMEISERMLYTV